MGLAVVEGCTGRVVWRSYSRWGKAQEGIGRECVLCGPEQSGRGPVVCNEFESKRTWRHARTGITGPNQESQQ
jgi:hypothetical protein